MHPLLSLVWKNWLLFRRNWIGSVLMLLIPIMFVAVIAIPIRNLFTTTDYPAQFFMTNASLRQQFSLYGMNPYCYNETIGLSPSSDSLIGQLSTLMASKGLETRLFSDQSAMETFMRAGDYGIAEKRLCLGINVAKSTGRSYEYSIRMSDSDQVPRPTTLSSDLKIDLSSFTSYTSQWFLLVQNWIDNIILKTQSGNSALQIKNIVTPVPQQTYTVDDLYASVGSQIDILPIFALLIVFLRNIYNIVLEKESQVKYSMGIMGMSKLTYMLSWLIAYLPVYIILAAISAAFLTYFTPKVAFGVYFIMYFLFGLLLCVQAMFVSIFFSRPKIAISAASLFFVAQYLVVLSVRGKDTLTAAQTLWVGIVPTASMALTFTGLIFASSNGIDVTVSNLNIVVKNIRLSGFFIFTPIIIVCYVFLIWYFQQVIPNDFGAYKHPLFFLGFIRDYKKPEHAEGGNIEPAVEITDQKPDQQKIVIKDLYKVYGQKTVVKGISFEIYQNQIFSLLGHNGAGKSTTLSILSGILQPSSGQIKYFGHNFQEIENLIGFCPQRNTLFDELTVQQHLLVFSSLKNVQDENMINELIKDVNLQQKRDTLAMNLSGGQKRKLCLAISLVGGSKVIFLDEPTSGMDAYSRRFVWEMIRKYKQGRIIILTTHFMDEADYLGDRIGIMDKGLFKCIGSSLYLKNKYGIGYSLTIAKTDSKINSAPIIELIKNMIPDTRIVSDVSLELTIQLPLSTSNKFAQLFNKLNIDKKRLNIESYGISITSLQDVFLRICQEQEQQEEQQHKKVQLVPIEQDQFISDSCSLNFSQFLGSLQKKIRLFRKDWKVLVYQISLPVLIVIGGILLGTINPISDQPSLTLSSSLYPTSKPFSALPFSLPGSSILTVSPSTITQFDIATNASNSNSMLYSAFMINSGNVYELYLEAQTRYKHSPPIMIMETNQALIRSLTGQDIKISVTHHPLPVTKQVIKINGLITGINVILVISVGFSFLFAMLVSAVVKQKQFGSKDIQVQCGLGTVIYWLSHYVLDYIKFLIISFVGVLFIKILDVESLLTLGRLQGMIVLFILYGLAALPFIYLTSFLFKEYGTAENGLFILNIIFSSFLPIVVFSFSGFSSSNQSILKGVSWFLSFVPFYGFGSGLIKVSTMELTSILKQKTFQVYDLQVFLPQIIVLSICIVLFWVALAIVENVHSQCLYNAAVQDDGQQAEIDPDVLKEKKNCQQPNSQNRYCILARSLKKQYKSFFESKLAVRGTSFGVEKGNIFALLGTNGAGKTTTFKMLTGQLLPSQGQILLKGKDLYSNLNSIRKQIGYCPQHDPLIDLLSPREHLQLIASIKGLNSQVRQKAIESMIDLVNLSKWADTNADQLSGGNKRKLCLAMALLGSPPIVYLDQPSTGMDPASRRFMWRVIEGITQGVRPCTVVLTTHSMEQAEALSKKMAIMVNGQFKCIGSVQHIKQRYGDGYQLQVKFQIPITNIPFKIYKQFDENTQTLSNAVHSDHRLLKSDEIAQKGDSLIQRLNSLGFKEITLLQKFNNYFRFKILMSSSEIGDMFRAIQNLSQSLGIQQYSLKQSTVEQIFNKLAAEGDVQQQ